MSELENKTAPGPWSAAPAADEAPEPTPQPEARPRPLAEGGQHPAAALVSTALLGALLWWVMGSWVFAVAGIFGLLVHEYGHVLAMNRLGMGPARIHIIPFLGGVARGQRPPADEWRGVLISLAGPAFGLLAMLPFVAVWMVTGGGLWLLGAWFIALINLLNLAPAPPLDGSKALGPVLARVHPTLEKAALLLVGALAVIWGVTHGSYLFAGFLALSVFQHMRRGAWRSSAGPLTWTQAGQSLGLYLVTAAVCVAAAIAAVLPLTGGSIPDAAVFGLHYFGVNL